MTSHAPSVPEGDLCVEENPYWETVRTMPGDRIALRFHGTWEPDPYPIDWVNGEPTIRRGPDRHDLTTRFAFTITDPASVAFVAGWSGDRIVDPMAGTGYWGYVLRQLGVAYLGADRTPPTSIPVLSKTEVNGYHRGVEPWVPVLRAEGTATAAAAGDSTLLLSWPPYATDDGARVLAAYPGLRVIYIGEGECGCTGDDELHERLAKDWREVADHRPVQWSGIHDWITVYERT